MTIGIYKFTKRGRYLLGIIFTILNLTLVMLGIVTTSWSLHICFAVAPQLYSEKSEVTFIFAVTGMYGTHIIFQFLIGIKICEKCYHQTHKKSTRKLLLLWTLSGCNTTINIVIIGLLSVKIFKHMVRSMRHSFEKGMRNYLVDLSWKHNIDRLQITMKCCGLNGYKDWYDIPWLDKYHVKEDSDAVKQWSSSKEQLLLPVTPWSCCRSDFPMQCLHDPLQQVESAYLWAEQPDIILQSIYTNGCLPILRKPLEGATVGIIFLTLFLVILWVAVIIDSRLLFTSCKNALILNDPGGIAPGWIFGRGDCGYTGGPSVHEIMMEDEKSQISDSAHTSDERKKNRTSKSSSPFSVKGNKKKFTEGMEDAHSSDENPVSSGEEEDLMLR